MFGTHRLLLLTSFPPFSLPDIINMPSSMTAPPSLITAELTSTQAQAPSIAGFVATTPSSTSPSSDIINSSSVSPAYDQQQANPIVAPPSGAVTVDGSPSSASSEEALQAQTSSDSPSKQSFVSRRRGKGFSQRSSQRAQSSTSLHSTGMLLLYIRGWKNTLIYSDVSVECAKLQSSVVSYCCTLWNDVAPYVCRLSYINTPGQ